MKRLTQNMLNSRLRKVKYIYILYVYIYILYIYIYNVDKSTEAMSHISLFRKNRSQNCSHFHKNRNNFCYSCNVFLCLECYQFHILKQTHISGSKFKINKFSQDQLLNLEEQLGNIKKIEDNFSVYELKRSKCNEAKLTINNYISTQLENINSCNLGLINERSTEKGIKLQRKLLKKRKENENLILENREENRLLAIKILNEKKFQSFGVEAEHEQVIEDSKRHTLFKEVERVENIIVKRKKRKYWTDIICTIIPIALGLTLLSLLFMIALYSFKIEDNQDINEKNKSKLDEKKETYTNIGYQSTIIDKNLTNLVQSKKIMEDSIDIQKIYNLGKSSEIISRKQQIQLFIEYISELKAQIEKLKIAHSSTNSILSETVDLQGRKINRKSNYSELVVISFAQSILNHTKDEAENILASVDSLHSNLLKIADVAKYWIILKHIGGTFLILSGKVLHGISILWVEKQEIIGHIPIRLVQRHILVHNTIIITIELGDQYFLNLFNFLITKTILGEKLFYLTKNQMDINKVEMISSIYITESKYESKYIEYNMINSKVERSVILSEPPIVHGLLICQQLPQIIVQPKTDELKAISKETGLITVNYELHKLQTPHLVFYFLEFPNKQLGVIEIGKPNSMEYKILNLYDQKTGKYIERVEIKSIKLDNIIRIIPLSLDGNIFIVFISYKVRIINLDTRTEIWQSDGMHDNLGIALVLDENNIIFTDFGNIYQVNLKDNSLRLLFVLNKYEAKKFNYLVPVYQITTISSISFPPSSPFTLKQI